MQRNRLRVETRKWFASKLHPRVYGEKVTAGHSGPDDAPIPVAVESPDFAALSTTAGENLSCLLLT
jgi:hypothetical protein